MPPNFGPKILKLKKGGILYKVKRGTSAVCWKDKQEVHLLTTMHKPPLSRHYVGEGGKTSKPLCIESYNSNIGFFDMSDTMANSYSISQETWK
jgi:hypothetical protein